MLLERAFGRGDQILGADAATGTVAEYEPGPRVVDATEVNASYAMRRVDLDHRRAVCRRTMSFGRVGGLSSETATKGTHR